MIGNEKGGAGKSTLAALIAISMLYRGQRVSVIDLDLRQQSLSRLLANRRRWLPAAGVEAPSPLEYKLVDDPARIADDQPTALRLFEEAMTMAMGDSDLIIIDTPGGDTAVSRAAHLQADLIVTPMNDSFVDFDVIGNVDPVTMRLIRPSHYAETILNARAMRAQHNRRLDWVVVRNRLAGADTNNRERVGKALNSLAEEVGFRIGPPLRERVAYREMFPFGLTLADVSPRLRPDNMSSPKLAARQEVNALLEALGLIVLARPDAPAARVADESAFAVAP
ncbi:MAG: division plane positioning ATPase MipZ [Parvibaculum sp.]|uniref:division plane positioning ATPase MipZ n=1 Tax=Parvibaculum sp. TaxID=2024848 RepID=UPI00272FE446|nr:division plane positioning ATPase MipZ [Parvibaculum sp.]MDP2151306.1 division plane positioning ATPase MipZ [Parvibaculum sp.]